MAVSTEAGSKKDFQTLIIYVDRLEQERAELLALREKVSDAERATPSLASRFQESPSKTGLLTQRPLIGSQEKHDARRLGRTSLSRRHSG
jgi:hypothetical protein